MIDINLIPAALRKNGKGDAGALKINVPREILLGVGGGLVLLMLMIHLLLGVVWLMGIGRLSYYNLQWWRVEPEKAMLDSINGQTGDFKKKIKALSDLTGEKSLAWAPKFNAISDSLPRGVWIRKMTLGHDGLMMEGSAVSKTQNEINSVGKFLSALRKDNDFMKGFSTLEENSLQGGKNNSVEVTDFSVMAKLK